MRAASLLWILAACTTDQPAIRNLFPEIAVTPPLISVGEVILTQSGSTELYITNAGQADLDVTLTLTGDPEITIDRGPEPFTVEPDTSVTVVVTLTPTNFLPYEAALNVASNDETSPSIDVLISGVGVDAPMPDIDVTPLTLDFGLVGFGDDALLIATLANVGEESLQFGSVTQTGSPAFTLVSNILPGSSIGPGSEQSLVVQYEPLIADVGDNGTLVIPSNDPDEPEVVIQLIGNGGGEFEYPVAELVCPDEVRIVGPTFVRLEGGTSYDPAGQEPLTYTWRTVRVPLGSGSQLFLPDVEVSTVDLPIDVGGEYEVELVVTNAIDTPSIGARCVINAVPDDKIRVELSWDSPSADMDLHLLESLAVEMWDVPGDACYCNQSPDWGSSIADDDPRLDIDARGDYGPENINILEPVDGEYPVLVHYFTDQPGASITVATVVVWSEGTRLWEGSKAMEKDQVWEVGQVNWPEASFAPSSAPLTDATRRDCRE